MICMFSASSSPRRTRKRTHVRLGRPVISNCTDAAVVVAVQHDVHTRRVTQVRVLGQGGHSSVPPIDHSSTSVALGRLLTALDDTSPPAALMPPITDFVRAIAPLVDSRAWRHHSSRVDSSATDSLHQETSLIQWMPWLTTPLCS